MEVILRQLQTNLRQLQTNILLATNLLQGG